MADLEGEQTKIEGGESTSEKGTASTQTGDKPTVSITETEEFRHALDSAIGKASESLNRQVSLSKAETNTAKAEAEQHKADREAFEAELKDLQKLHDDLVSKQFADDPEARQAYIDRRAIAEERRNLKKEKADSDRKLYAAERLTWEVGMEKKADALAKETGIDPAELKSCITEEEMEVKALRFEKTKEHVKEEQKPKFDSALSGGTGASWRDLSPDEKLTRGLSQKK